VNSFTGTNKKRVRIIFYARVNTQIGANGAVATLRYCRMLLAQLPQIEHSGTAEKSGK
jgi:hypothetical protein